MKGKVCILSGLLFAQLLIGLFTASSASAATVYDNSVQLTDNLEITSSTNSLHVDDLTTSYITKIYDLCGGQNGEYGLSLQNALQNGAWSVHTYKNPSTGKQDRVTMHWTESGKPSMALTQYEVRLSDFDVSRYATIMHNTDGSLRCIGSTPSTANNPLSDTSGTYKLFLSTYSITYPAGYEGAIIPQTHDVIEELRPEIEYSVNGKQITARYTGNLNDKVEDGYFTLAWSLSKKDDSTGDYILVDGSQRSAGPPPMVTPVTSDYTYTVKDNGTYQLILVPALSPQPDSFTLSPISAQLEIDGSSFVGNTSDMNCVDGACISAPLYEVCDTADFGCHFRNFGVFLKAMLVSLFVPNSTAILSRFSSMLDSLTETLGFLAYPLTFLIGLFQSMLNNTSGFGGVINFGNFFGGNVSLDIAGLEKLNADLFELGLNIFRGFTVFALMMALRHKYLEVVRA